MPSNPDDGDLEKDGDLEEDKNILNVHKINVQGVHYEYRNDAAPILGAASNEQVKLSTSSSHLPSYQHAIVITRGSQDRSLGHISLCVFCAKSLFGNSGFRAT